jgi:hypothetical protein
VPPSIYEITATLGSRTAAGDTGLSVEANRNVLSPAPPRPDDSRAA